MKSSRLREREIETSEKSTQKPPNVHVAMVTWSLIANHVTPATAANLWAIGVDQLAVGAGPWYQHYTSCSNDKYAGLHWSHLAIKLRHRIYDDRFITPYKVSSSCCALNCWHQKHKSSCSEILMRKLNLMDIFYCTYSIKSEVSKLMRDMEVISLS